ncbi:LysR family transcriptional regulator [Acidocella sp.]|uniref:LysR family transcriptional regulator n=1 Tax=Acidocella sp. TaxID=50710 RepID=UPI002620C174|nr:LysR family transcriptional regulator [Acidocella sp.]
MVEVFDLNIRHLYAAVVVVRLRSIGRAAEAIHLTQPALTHAVGKLEKQLNHKIFERLSNGVVPTPEGRMFLDHVEDGVTRLGGAAQILRQTSRLKALVAPERQFTTIQLRAFLAVLRTGGYTAAARELGLSQPSIYRAVRELQNFLGIPLFAPVGPVLRASEAVQKFATSVRLALADIQSGLDELSAIHEPGTGRVSIGSLPLARSALLPDLLSRFSAAFPFVRISVVEGQYAELVAALREGAIDAMFGALRADFDLPDLKQRVLFEDPLFVVGRRAHPALKGPHNAGALVRYPWIVPMRAAPARGIWERFFDNDGSALPARMIECASVLLARGLMLEGEWLGMMSRHQFKLEEAHGLLTRIGPPVPGSARPIGMTMRRGWRPTMVQAAFLAMTLEREDVRSSGGDKRLF